MNVTIIALGLTALGSLTGCTSEPNPAPTPTPAFASEAEAFAAAEEVYRAYNDAGNARTRGESEPDPQMYLISSALESDIDAQNSLRQWGLSAIGDAALLSFQGIEATLDEPVSEITGYVCIDVSGLRVVDAAGTDVTPPDRGDVVSQLVKFTGNREALMIAHEESADETSC